MAGTLFEDNLSPYLTAVEGTTPSNPAAGQQRLFVRSSDHVLCLVDSSGTVTTVGSGGGGGPADAHGCKVHRASTNVTVGNNTYTAVAFDAEDYDTDTMHDNSTNPTRATIPTISGVTTGLWAMNAYGYTDVTTGRINTQFRINGSTVVGWAEQLASSGVIGPFQGATAAVLSAADYIECMVRTVGGAGNAIFDAGVSPYFVVSFLGKVT
jgi:hypothetical protein